MIKFCSKYVFQYKIEYGIYFLLGIILCGLNTFIPAAMGQFINIILKNLHLKNYINRRERCLIENVKIA